jgi:hypothetical protein
VLVAGVGSYCAYRICAKYLGKEFVWTLMDAVRLDRISHADSRLLHPAAEVILVKIKKIFFIIFRAILALAKTLHFMKKEHVNVYFNFYAHYPRMIR